MWTLIIIATSWVYGGRGVAISSVPNFHDLAECETAAAVLRRSEGGHLDYRLACVKTSGA